MVKLSGKIAVVSGGTGALGKVLVDQLLNHGAVVITSLTGNDRSDFYISTKKSQFQSFDGIVVDVTSQNSVKKFYDEVFARHRKIDILCNLVGGIGKKKLIEDISLEEWNSTINLNLTSCFLMMRDSISSMKRNGFGRIINIAAMPGLTPEAKKGSYSVAKAGVIALTKCAAAELKEFKNITVNAIAPSIILTEENKKWGVEEDFKKWITPEQIAEMILHLCSENGQAINGQIIQMYGKV